MADLGRGKDRIADAGQSARGDRLDEEAVRAITKQHNRRLYRIARSVLRDDAEAKDAVQTAYLHAFAALPSFRGEAALDTWLTRIVLNESLSRLRSRRPTLSLEAATTVRSSGQIIPFPLVLAKVDPEQSTAQRQIQAVLEAAIDALPEAFRTVLVARVIEGMSVEETADLLSIKAETVKTRLHRARRLLRKSLERQIGPILVDAFPFGGRRCERMTTAVLRHLALA